jgi:hypothetical protein
MKLMQYILPIYLPMSESPPFVKSDFQPEGKGLSVTRHISVPGLAA